MTAPDEREAAQATRQDGTSDVTPLCVVIDVLGEVDWSRGIQFRRMREATAAELQAAVNAPLTGDEYLGRVVRACEGSVQLAVNPHLDDYETREQFLDRGYPELSSERRDRLLRANPLYELQFYRDTPIGFACVLGASLVDVAMQALEVIGERAI